MTGVINDFFDRSNVSPVLNGLADGSYGIIIDAVDEGRSKTNPDGFTAFLDDLVNRCRGSQSAAFVILGRTVVLEECWLYLSDKGIDTALAAIDPFSAESAKQYIDAFSGGLDSQYRSEYKDVRDKLIDLLAASFADSDRPDRSEFLRFLGYPPVLDSIVTLLREKPNYYGLANVLESTEDAIEATLIYRISTYILRREREDKVLTNVVRDRAVLHGLPEGEREKIRETVLGLRNSARV